MLEQASTLTISDHIVDAASNKMTTVVCLREARVTLRNYRASPASNTSLVTLSARWKPVTKVATIVPPVSPASAAALPKLPLPISLYSPARRCLQL